MNQKLDSYKINGNDEKILYISPDGLNLTNLKELVNKHGLSIVSEILGDRTIPLHSDTWRTFLNVVVHTMMFPNLGPEFEQDKDGNFIKDFSDLVQEVTGQVDEINLNPDIPDIPKDETIEDEKITSNNL